MYNKKRNLNQNYVSSDWLDTDQPSLPIACLNNLELEPFFCHSCFIHRSFVVRISTLFPFYHDGFIDYGFNQIALFEHLRLRGYKMQLLGQSFVVAPFQKMWV